MSPNAHATQNAASENAKHDQLPAQITNTPLVCLLPIYFFNSVALDVESTPSDPDHSSSSVSLLLFSPLNYKQDRLYIVDCINVIYK